MKIVVVGGIADAHARYFGAEVNERSLLPGDEAELGTIRFDEWLGRPAVAAGAGSKRAPLKENEIRLSEDGEIGRVEVPRAHAIQGV